MPSKQPISTNEGAVIELESFQYIAQGEVPKGREGKHKRIVKRLLADIANLNPATALKVPLSALPDSKENIRSALNRATRQLGIDVATSSDEEHLYIWKVTPKE
ncbi:MAG: hypothetical protein ABSD70_07705 [Terracidiphilus sp.]|jgi:hypothetical protein